MPLFIFRQNFRRARARGALKLMLAKMFHAGVTNRSGGRSKADWQGEGPERYSTAMIQLRFVAESELRGAACENVNPVQGSA
jgi:hypothetical protein